MVVKNGDESHGRIRKKKHQLNKQKQESRKISHRLGHKWQESWSLFPLVYGLIGVITCWFESSKKLIYTQWKFNKYTPKWNIAPEKW